MSTCSDLPAAAAPDASTWQRGAGERPTRALAGVVTLLGHLALVGLFLWRPGLPDNSGMRAAAQRMSVTLVAAAPAVAVVDLPPPKPLPAPPLTLEPPPTFTVQAPQLPIPDRPSPEAISLPAVEVAPAHTTDPAPQAPAQPAPAVPPAPQAAAPNEAAPNSLTRTAGQATWESEVLAHLERNKRYPAAARLRRQEDVIYVRFTVTRQGQVSGARVMRSQGFTLLDEEVLSLLHRAVPLPPMPADMPGDSVELMVPVEFFMRGR